MAWNLYVCAQANPPDQHTPHVIVQLARHAGADHVFGVHGPELDALARCDAVVVLMGANWPHGSSNDADSLDDPADPMRLALISAAQQRRLIVPLILPDGRMPEAEDLPDSLRFLHYRNALMIDGAHLHADVARAWREIDLQLAGRSTAWIAGAAFWAGAGWFIIVNLLAWITSLGTLSWPRPLFAHELLSSLVAIGPLLVFVTAFGVHLLGRRRREGFAVLLFACVLLTLVEILRPGPDEALALLIALNGLDAAFTGLAAFFGVLQVWHITLVPWLLWLYLSRPFAGVLLGSMLGALGYLAFRPSRLTYSFRDTPRIRLQALYRQATKTHTAVGIYLSCRAEDRSATYEALRSYLEKELVQDPSMQIPFAIYSTADTGGGTDTSDRLEEMLRDCLTVVAVIGPHWLSATDTSGRPAIEDPADHVRRELTLALGLGAAIVPVLIDGAPLPTAGVAPPELAAALNTSPVQVDSPQESELVDVLMRVLAGGVPRHRWLIVQILLDAYSALLGSPEAGFKFVPEVFLSYRRADSGMACNRIHRWLRQDPLLGRRVFRDTDAIAMGTDFTLILDDAIDDSRAVLVLIGPQWASVTSADGLRRLDDPQDMVRKEVAGALAANKTVIPVLVGGAAMPTAEELPRELAPLAHLPPIAVRGDYRFPWDVMRLAAFVRRQMGIERHPLLALAAASAALLVLLTDVDALLHRVDDATALFDLAPRLCSSVSALLLPCPPTNPDPGSMQLFLMLNVCSVVAVGSLSLIAVQQMARFRQWSWAAALAAPLAAMGAMALAGFAMLRGLAGAYYLVPGTGTFLVLPEVLLGGIRVVAPALCLALARYFWRSRGRPYGRPDPAAGEGPQSTP